MRWLHINHKGAMWPLTGFFIHADRDKFAAYAPGVDLVLAFTRPGRVEWKDNFTHRTVVARRRYWVRFSWNPWFRFYMTRGVTPADEKP